VKRSASFVYPACNDALRFTQHILQIHNIWAPFWNFYLEDETLLCKHSLF